PIIKDPIRLVGADYENGVLSLKLNRPVNPEWLQALQNMGGYTFQLGKEPQRFVFQGSLAQIPARHDELQAIVNYFKDWLPRANTLYRDHRERVTRKAEEEKRQKLQRDIEEEQRRLTALQNLRI